MIQLWVDTWKKAGPELEAIRRREIAEADNVHVVALLEDAFNHAAGMPPRTTSGLIEMQRILEKLR
jgi:hypothetical protein